MTDNLLFDNMTALLNKRQIIETSINSNKEKIEELQRQLNELNEQNAVLVRSKFSVNREIQAEEERQRLEALKREEERRLRAEMLSMKEVDEEIRKLCEGFEAYDKAHPYQIEDVVSSINAYKSGKRGMLNANDMGMGKATTLTSKILTPNGWVMMGDLEVGSIITGKNGLPQTVTNIFPQGVLPIYRVTMSDGTSTMACLEHLWEVRDANDKRRGNKRVMTTEQIMNDLTSTMGGRAYMKWFIPTVEPVEYNPQPKLPIHPYVLGALLGDGSFRSNNVTFACHKNDKQIVDIISKLIEDEVNVHSNNLSYGFSGTVTREKIKKLGLWGHKSETKFIPDMYKLASIDDRIELIRGLMDTDGSCSLNHLEFSSSSKQLAYDVAEVIRSLGGIVTIKTKTPTYTHKGSKFEGLLHYRLSIKWGLEDKPFHLVRKANNMSASQYSCEHGIKSIEYVGDFEAQCIRVSNPDHLYVTDDFIVTHNTFESAIVLYCMQKLLAESLGRKPKILWLTKKSLVTKESTKKEIARWNPNWKTIQPVDGGSPAQREFVVEFYRDSDMADMFLANYEFVRTTPVAQTMKWDIIVVDEVHKLKGGANSNGPTNIWTSIKNLCVNAEYVLMLSGTPMVNAPEEMWSYLHIFNPEKFPDLKTFKKNFMEYKTIAGEFKLVVDANKLLEQVLKGQMIRRSAKEVGLQIPELNYEVVELERTPEQDAAYKQMQNHFFVWLDEQQDRPLSAMAIIAQLTRLRQINVWPVVNFTRTDENGYEVTETLDIRESSKIDEAMDIIDNAQDQVIIFSTFNEPMYEIQRRCRLKGLRCEIISGSEKHNFDVEAEFQQGRINVLCLNSSMGEGLNLQKNPEHWPGGASYGIFLDLWWSPARNEQCIKRIHRQGSSIPVFIYELQNVPSVDQFIKAKNDEKNEQFNSIMESGEIRPASEWKKLLGG